MACTPETKFDGFTQMLASGVTRRDALKWVGAAALGAMLTTVGSKQAEAAGPCKGSPDGCIGTVPCNGCSSGLGCFCGAKIGKTKTKKCFVNEYCTSLVACTSNKDCKSLGRKCLCAANGCSESVCVAPCTSCPSSSSGRRGSANKTIA